MQQRLYGMFEDSVENTGCLDGSVSKANELSSEGSSNEISRTKWQPGKSNRSNTLDFSNLVKYVWLGRQDQYWYQDCEKVFRELFGDDKLLLVTQLFAATSINTSLKANITLFRRAYHEMSNGLPFGNYLPNITLQLNRLRSGASLSGRKINSFANAMAGDPNAVVVDIWLMRAFGIDIKYSRNRGGGVQLRNGSPTDKQYTLVESYVREAATGMGVQPRELSAMIWSGCRIAQSGDRETRYTSILRQQLTNLFGVI